jgi:hypothetical protein
MVRHKVLRLTNPVHQLTHPQITIGELGQQTPTHRVGSQANERWRRHMAGKDHTGDYTSILFDVLLGVDPNTGTEGV